MARSAKLFRLEKWWATHTKEQIIFSTLAVLLAPAIIFFALSSFTDLAFLSILKNLMGATVLADPALAMAITCFASALCLGLFVAAKLWPKEMIEWGNIKYASFQAGEGAESVIAPPPAKRKPTPPLLHYRAAQIPTSGTTATANAPQHHSTRLIF